MTNRNGFTLAEFIVALLIFVITMVALYTTYEMVYRTSKHNIAEVQTSERLRPALLQIERFIKDAGYGIALEDLKGDTVAPDNLTASNINNLAAISVYEDGDYDFNVTNNDYSNSLDINIKSIIGDYPYSGNYVVYDENIFDSTDEVRNALGMPAAESDFNTIVMDVSKNINTTIGLVNGIPALNSLNSGDIILVAKNSADSINDYYYIKRIELSSTPNRDMGNKYNMCNPLTYNLQVARIDPDNATINYQPLIPCVAYFNADFGCSDGSNIRWQKDICNNIKDLKIIRVGLIVQNGYIYKDYQYSEGDRLRFPSLGKTDSPNNDDPVEYELQVDNNNIRNDMRYYKWEIIERYITTPNVVY